MAPLFTLFVFFSLLLPPHEGLAETPLALRSDAQLLREWRKSSILEAKSWYKIQREILQTEIKDFYLFYRKESEYRTLLLDPEMQIAAAELLKQHTFKRNQFFTEHAERLNSEFNHRMDLVRETIKTVLSTPGSSRLQLAPYQTAERVFDRSQERSFRWEKYRGDVDYVSLQHFEDRKLDVLPTFSPWEGQAIYQGFKLDGVALGFTEKIHYEVNASFNALRKGAPDRNLSWNGEGKLTYRGRILEPIFLLQKVAPPILGANGVVSYPSRIHYEPVSNPKELNERLEAIAKDTLKRKRLFLLLRRSS